MSLKNDLQKLARARRYNKPLKPFVPPNINGKESLLAWSDELGADSSDGASAPSAPPQPVLPDFLVTQLQPDIERPAVCFPSGMPPAGYKPKFEVLGLVKEPRVCERLLRGGWIQADPTRDGWWGLNDGLHIELVESVYKLDVSRNYRKWINWGGESCGTWAYRANEPEARIQWWYERQYSFDYHWESTRRVCDLIKNREITTGNYPNWDLDSNGITASTGGAWGVEQEDHQEGSPNSIGLSYSVSGEVDQIPYFNRGSRWVGKIMMWEDVYSPGCWEIYFPPSSGFVSIPSEVRDTGGTRWGGFESRFNYQATISAPSSEIQVSRTIRTKNYSVSRSGDMSPIRDGGDEAVARNAPGAPEAGAVVEDSFAMGGKNYNLLQISQEDQDPDIRGYQAGDLVKTRFIGQRMFSNAIYTHKKTIFGVFMRIDLNLETISKIDRYIGRFTAPSARLDVLPEDAEPGSIADVVNDSRVHYNLAVKLHSGWQETHIILAFGCSVSDGNVYHDEEVPQQLIEDMLLNAYSWNNRARARLSVIQAKDIFSAD